MAMVTPADRRVLSAETATVKLSIITDSVTSSSSRLGSRSCLASRLSTVWEKSGR